jgi:D-cysteine desulfhydrase family pyridoxal phosphate-dependent enzyme
MGGAGPMRSSLGSLPTPLQPLPRLTQALGGPQIHVKRDDLTGLAFGGNKTRKLELLVADALARGARTLLTRGAAQSNHCRQTAAAAAQCGLGCVLVLQGHAPAEWTGNLFLDELLGAEIVWSGAEPPEQALEGAFERARSAGHAPYRIPYGGSGPLGAAAYGHAMAEMLEQDAGFDTIVVASSSGGTQAGLVAGARLYGFGGRIVGISIEPEAGELRRTVAALAGEAAGVLGEPLHVEPGEIEVLDGYRGGGYGVLGALEREAIRLFARLEGLLLDPVYTGRAAGALLDLVRLGRLGAAEQRVLFWHTGGTPALFAYASGLRGEAGAERRASPR